MDRGAAALSACADPCARRRAFRRRSARRAAGDALFRRDGARHGRARHGAICVGAGQSLRRSGACRLAGGDRRRARQGPHRAVAGGRDGREGARRRAALGRHLRQPRGLARATRPAPERCFSSRASMSEARRFPTSSRPALSISAFPAYLDGTPFYVAGPAALPQAAGLLAEGALPGARIEVSTQKIAS